MVTNSQPAQCVRCKRSVLAGEGKFVGKGMVMHKQPCALPRKPSTKKMLKLAKDFLAP